nr:Chain P, SIYR PEPTIDE [synthetic construct]1G6R_Q Chain Q, SIYR PEPTIDE [synthetic construct]
SIYRYYGL